MRAHGFNLVRETEIPELKSRVRIWRHSQSGARVLSFMNEDENKVFGVSFRTPPKDSTGLPHILEHSVLCGSEKYPVKEPFVELLKGSLQTFLNAFTYPDKTCYPVASANLRDFRNLTDVYLDAVFFPRINEDIFKQEGWHLEAADAAAPLTFKGVVYNEMKGVFSSPEAVLGRHCLHALFPDTLYGLESGGDPEVIPTLTYADFKTFHNTYYHPANARFFFWGDDPEDGRLAQLGAVLARFNEIEVDSAVGLQKPFAAPRRVTLPYAASEGDKAMLAVNWLLPSVEDVEQTLGLQMLEHILLGMPASPLRLALIESGLGEDLTGDGLEDELRQLTFGVGLKGVEEKDIPAVEALIQEVLSGLAEQGIPAVSVEAALNSVEFALRENNSGRFPVGLAVMLRSLATWLHDDSETGEAGLAPLRYEAPLAAIKEKIRRGGYFEGLLDKWLVNNPHRATVILLPDLCLAEKTIQAEQDKLQKMSAALSPAEREAVAADTLRLKALQEAPDSPEALASIPRLHLADLPRQNRPIAQEKTPLPALFHPQPCGGISYVTAAFDMSPVPERLLHLLPLFGRALLEMGTQKRDFATLSLGIACKTGGMDTDLLLLTRREDRRPTPWFVLQGKAAPDKVEDMFELYTDVLTSVRLDDSERFTQMLLEEKARLEHGLVPAGHAVVSARLKASQSLTGWLDEASSGFSSLEKLRDLAKALDKSPQKIWPAVLADLEELRRLLLRRGGLLMGLTAEEKDKDRLLALSAGLAAALPDAAAPRAEIHRPSLPPKEALILPAQVNYMGKGANLYAYGYKYHGSALVIIKYLRTGRLWEKVRVQGGAYGAHCSLDRMSGDFVLTSYRDPNTLGTLEIFDSLAGHLMEVPRPADLEAAIIGAIGELDTHLLPDAKGMTAFARHLTGDADEIRQKLREEILGTRAEDLRAFGEILARAMPEANICALGGQALEKDAKERNWTITKAM